VAGILKANQCIFMKLSFVWVGRTKSKPMNEMIEDYLSRVGKFAPVETSILRGWTAAGNGSKTHVEKEGADILARTDGDPFVVLLTETGKQFDSAGFARLIDNHRTGGTKKMTFVVGGHEGVSTSVEQRADLKLGLSGMTFTHDMTRLVLAEQVYRAFTIINNLPYQR
jgi:23S rRNA (pseudouridine1915-N3)-methyltransferase